MERGDIHHVLVGGILKGLSKLEPRCLNVECKGGNTQDAGMWSAKGIIHKVQVCGVLRGPYKRCWYVGC